MAPLLLVTMSCGSREVPIIGDETVCEPSVDAELIEVIDGDTVDVRRSGASEVERVRLLGVQAGEIFQDDGEQACASQDDGDCCYGLEAEAWLEDLLDRVDSLVLGFDAECTDTYGRTLGYLWIDDPEDPDALDLWFINEQLLTQGIARYFDEEIGEAQNIRFKDDFEAAESEAAAQALGLWSVCE